MLSASFRNSIGSGLIDADIELAWLRHGKSRRRDCWDRLLRQVRRNLRQPEFHGMACCQLALLANTHWVAGSVLGTSLPDGLRKRALECLPYDVDDEARLCLFSALSVPKSLATPEILHLDNLRHAIGRLADPLAIKFAKAAYGMAALFLVPDDIGRN